MGNSIAEPVILVVSSNEDFAKPLAEQVINELGLPCAVTANYEAAKPIKPSITLIVTNEAVADNLATPVLRVKEPPYKMQELLNDISSARQKQIADEIDIGGSYKLHTRKKEMVHIDSGKAVLLTDKEVKLLQSIIEENGKVVSKEQLLKQVWGMELDLDTHTLETHIYRLRAKLRELGDDEMVIAADGGYKLVEK